MTVKQANYWNEVAGPKWAASQEEMDAVLAPYAETLREAARVPSNCTLVDVGCGCGATTLMARKESPDATIIGLDISEPMLAVARRRAADRDDLATQFKVGDAATEELGESSVDRVISRFGLMFFEDPVAAFANMRRWLKPDGLLVAVVWAEAKANPWMTSMIAVLAQHLNLSPPDPDTPGPFALGSSRKRRELVEAAGFHIREERLLDQPVHVTGDVDEVVRFYGARGAIAQALEDAEPRARTAALKDLRASVVEHHDGSGVSLPGRAIRISLGLSPATGP